MYAIDLSPPQAHKWIPDLSEMELQSRLEKIRPVVRFGKMLYYIKPGDPKNSSFLMHPTADEMAILLRPVEKITTYHEHGHRRNGHFKPSVAEVLAAIPNNLVDVVVAFEVLGPVCTAEEAARHKAAFNDGLHVATTQLYRHA